jgi:hypothetical protein
MAATASRTVASAGGVEELLAHFGGESRLRSAPGACRRVLANLLGGLNNQVRNSRRSFVQ